MELDRSCSISKLPIEKDWDWNWKPFQTCLATQLCRKEVSEEEEEESVLHFGSWTYISLRQYQSQKYTFLIVHSVFHHNLFSIIFETWTLGCSNSITKACICFVWANFLFCQTWVLFFKLEYRSSLGDLPDYHQAKLSHKLMLSKAPWGLDFCQSRNTDRAKPVE